MSLGLLAVLMAWGMVFSATGSAQESNPQDPNADPRGWMVPARAGTVDIGLNRPVSIDSEFPQPTTSSFEANRLRLRQPSMDEVPSDFIRNQIGLASFESDDDLVLVADSHDDHRSIGSPVNNEISPLTGMFGNSTNSFTSPDGIQGSLKFAVLLGALSLAPAIILMTTCYIRVVVVLSLLKQAFGGHQLPPAQVLTALALFITFLIMTPVWQDLKQNAIDPYSANEIGWEEAWARGTAPIKSFMVRQIELAGNGDSVAVFYKYADVGTSMPPSELSDVPLNVLIPAFMISELKVAFLLGFQIYLPFLVMDLIVSSVTVSMGMLMLPPQMVSFPLKLILFVLVDGWNLVIGMLLQSFGMMLPVTG
jgi:flagellar biosynthetic protein FliP